MYVTLMLTLCEIYWSNNFPKNLNPPEAINLNF